MSYRVLARKSRPQNFSEVVGQESVVKTLQNSIRKNQVAHAILFSGVRGVGKTTLARIMAKALNCTGETDSPPCDTCPSCKEIAEGSALDLIEIDGASNRGIQEIRELKEKIKFMPTSCQYKIIIIDEVHMLTTEAFNALLKTIEEPPDHVKFMFATTEFHKIPVTVLSRCQRHELKRIPADQLNTHFNKLAEGEGITIDQSALNLIVRESGGSVRDGLSLLDQVFAYGEKHITANDVTELLGLVDRELILELARALLTNDGVGALHAIDNLYSDGLDIKRFSSDLLDCFRTLLFTRIHGCSDLIDQPTEEIERYADIAKDYSAPTIHQKLNLLMQLVEDLKQTSQPRITIETGILKIIEAGNVVSVTDILGKIQGLQGQQSTAGETIGTPGAPTAAPSPPGEHAKKKIADNTPEPPPAQVKKPASAPPAEPPPQPPVDEIPPPEQPPPPAPPAEQAVQDTTAAPPVPLKGEKNTQPKPVKVKPHEKDVRRDWPEFLDFVKRKRMWMGQVLIKSASAKQVNDELHIHFDDPAECALLRDKTNKIELTEYVLDFFQKELTVHFDMPEGMTNGDVPDVDSPQYKRKQLEKDPLTIMTAEIFNGQVGDIRIGSKNR